MFELINRMYEIDGENGPDKYGLLWNAVLEEAERNGFRFAVDTDSAPRNVAVISEISEQVA